MSIERTDNSAGKTGCFIVAEVSANHGQSLKRAVEMIRKAKECGADAVKFQTYTPDTITIDSDSRYFKVRHSEWKGQTLYDLYKKAYTPWEWFGELKKTAREEGITFFSAAFDRTSVDFLEELDVPFHKIASFELVDLPLVEYAARTGKPLIMSTGMATEEEITEAVKTARGAGAGEITLLKCVSAYPAVAADMNLRAIPEMKKKYKCAVGLSDHSLGIGVAVASVALGACMVEKHFILSKRLKTPDSFFSSDAREFRRLVDNIRTAEAALGSACHALSAEEKRNRMFRRSLFAVREIKKGELFTEYNIRSIRPGNGLKPGYYNKVLGKKAAKNIKRGTPLGWELVV
ncbi:MAG: pseudaminic acid synthase [Candidatus Omnitrophota bacterium]